MADHVSRRAEQWLESGLLDAEFYAALRGESFSDAEAAEDFVEHGMPERLSPHPLLHFVSLPAEARRAWRRGRTGELLRRLVDWNLRLSRVERTRMLRLATQLAAESSPAAPPAPAAIDWEAVAHRPREPGHTSVVVVAAEFRPTVRAVRSVLRRADQGAVDVWVVDPGTPPHVALGLEAALLDHADVQVLRLPGRPVVGTNMAIAQTRGDTIALLDPHLVVRRDWLAGVRGALDDAEVAAVQPLLLRPEDDTIDCAGLVRLAPLTDPIPILAEHPKEDARRLGGQRLEGISPAAVVVRAEDVVATGGLDPRMPRDEAVFDLCARLTRRRPGGLRVAPHALVTDHQAPRAAPSADRTAATAIDPDGDLYERLGFVTARRAEQLVVTAVHHPSDQRRWSILLPSTAGHWGDDWGDTHFAEALAAALRRLGQDVVTRRRGGHQAGPTHLDDVSLALRGLHPIPPTPGQVNVLWVISHPDDVDPRELEGYDVVGAASTTWSAELSERTQREVLPLLQASEFTAPKVPSPTRQGEPSVVFVGSSDERRERRFLLAAVEAGVPLSVYGPGWDHLPPGIWRGEHVDNRRLPELYRHHGVVLADHWPDMARHGFVANRVFDAVASGARVICDEVEGIHDVFDPRDVVVATTTDEIAAAFDALRRVPAGEDVPRPSLTFDDRARTLLDRLLAQGSSRR